ncbi:MAG TPA: AAA family ATPase [Myxococcota bacterium]|nr:AAA family ATPase [Myxococcota bacterium]
MSDGAGPRLVLLGGPPGVGKSSALARLERKLARGACLDADDVRRFRPAENGTAELEAGVRNVIAVLRGYLEARAPVVVLAWVLADPRLVERILSELDGLYGSVTRLYLVASHAALEARLRREPERPHSLEYALAKLAQIEALPQPKLDTTGLDADAVAERILAQLG